jgi:hypothetical protein
MAERKLELPKIGDLTIATIEGVTDYVAYAKFDVCSLYNSKFSYSKPQNRGALGR